MRGWSPIIDIAALGPGQGLRLFATFKPTPLLRVLESKGFVHEAKELEGGEWEVLFRPSKAAVADGDGGAVLPTDDSVWSEPAQHLDNRDLDPVCTENLNPHVMVMAGEKKHGTLVAAVSTIENLVGGYGVKPGALWCRALRLGR